MLLDLVGNAQCATLPRAKAKAKAKSKAKDRPVCRLMPFDKALSQEPAEGQDKPEAEEVPSPILVSWAFAGAAWVQAVFFCGCAPWLCRGKAKAERKALEFEGQGRGHSMPCVQITTESQVLLSQHCRSESVSLQVTQLLEGRDIDEVPQQEP